MRRRICGQHVLRSLRCSIARRTIDIGVGIGINTGISLRVRITVRIRIDIRVSNSSRHKF